MLKLLRSLHVVVDVENLLPQINISELNHHCSIFNSDINSNLSVMLSSYCFMVIDHQNVL